MVQWERFKASDNVYEPPSRTSEGCKSGKNTVDVPDFLAIPFIISVIKEAYMKELATHKQLSLLCSPNTDCYACRSLRVYWEGRYLIASLRKPELDCRILIFEE